ncbi:CDP-alcohol phosphatidyltransferase family protein [Georgenia subflava]|uniref:CDP-alcohol phosphatidyltransferase family protein n=1 Tax=Georgenia subflava TaxID=1622177 RepID=A0A6N7EJJ7_9MICO|nr:CDP-alcohol phosphatidyltransferase family protein [Georgenia subflava]MPV36366.1 CDP-alcohol phosphatidyltransferase family protein [Georgenia subflava]
MALGSATTAATAEPVEGGRGPGVADARAWPRRALLGGLLGSLTLPVLLTAAGHGGPVLVVGSLAYVVGAALVALCWPSRALGAANQLTLARLVLTSWVLAALAPAHHDSWAVPVQLGIVVAGVTCLVLDGIDGRVARARGSASAFGARFDVEVDAALVLVLSAAVPLLGVAGWWVLGIGIVRYAYVAASLRWRWLRGAVFPSTARKVVGVCQVVALLVALLCPLLPEMPVRAPSVILGLALAGLCWSFGRDARWQHARRF